MNKFLILIIIVFTGLAIDSCTKEKIVTKKVEITPLTDSLGIILAGAKGSSKSWNLTSLSLKVNSGTTQTASGSEIPSCESDNIFTFSNNSIQSYTELEGNTLCNQADSTTVEKGSWAFTNDGKSLLIDGFYYATSTQFNDSNESFLVFYILAQGIPLTVKNISDSTFTLSYTASDSSNTYYITVTFTKKI